MSLFTLVNNVNDAAPNDRTFASLVAKDCFVKSGELHMKLTNTSGVNAVNLDTGTATALGGTDVVTATPAKIDPAS
jgi:hypothetical protein